MELPLVHLKRRFAKICPRARQAVLEVLESGEYIAGKNTDALEREFAAYMGVKYAISVANGTDALCLALQALGVGPGDEVITTPYSFFATVEAVLTVGARPVFVDVRADTYNLDETQLEKARTVRTKAVLPVHLFGQPAEMDAIGAFAKRHNLFVVEDAAQAAGALYRGKQAGACSDVACFSFFPTKNLSCAGDGGMVLTSNARLACLCRALSRHGSGEAGRRAYAWQQGLPQDETTPQGKYIHYLAGRNSRLDEIQAALLRLYLEDFPNAIAQRRAAAAWYRKALAGLPFTLPTQAEGTQAAYHMFVLQSTRRKEVCAFLQQRGIATAVYYPLPLHLQPALAALGYAPGNFPVAEALCKTMFAIPFFPEITNEEQAAVVAALCEACQ